MPGEETEQLNAGHPSSDKDHYRHKIIEVAETVGTLAGVADPRRQAQEAAKAFVPDVLRHTPGSPARFHPGSAKGRALDDNAFGAAISLLVGHPLAGSSAPFVTPPAFPYVAGSHQGDLPALLELFGLRAPGADPA